MKELQALGIKTILDLEAGVRNKLGDDYYEDLDTEKEFGIRRVRLFLSNIFPISEEKAELALKEIKENGPVFVHCKFGADRTGGVCLIYEMIEKGLAVDKGLLKMYEHGFHKWPYMLWVPFFKRLVIKLKAKRGLK